MISGCVGGTGYYSESYSGMIYEDPVYAEPVFVIDDRAGLSPSQARPS
jgi:trehalose/maltose hydrolase-like predicted phosphorylase